MTTVATLGLIHLWNFEDFSEDASDFFDMKDSYAKAGACIALGLCCSGVRDESEPAMALLSENLESEDNNMKLGSLIGFGLAYANHQKEDIKELFQDLIYNEELDIEVNINAALAQSLVFLASKDEDTINSILTSMMIFQKDKIEKKEALFFGVALALNFLGKQNECEACLEALDGLENKWGKIFKVIVESAAYIGSGNVLKI
jgi:26S proteasome regulatory subunit N1